MHSWSYIQGTFQPQPVSNILFQRQQQQQQEQSTQSGEVHQSSGDLQTGEFVEVANIVTSARPPVVRASHQSQVVVGVVTDKPDALSAVIKSHGLAFAWVCKGTQTPPLSGFYAKSVNGISECNVVIDVQGPNFTIAATKDKELEALIARFNALAS